MRVIEKARVISVEHGRAVVKVLPPADREKCVACPAAAVCGQGAGRPRDLAASAPEHAKVGDVVKIAIEGPSPARAAFLLLILPLVTAFVCGVSAWALTGGVPTGVVAGLIGAAGVFMAIRLTGAGARGRVEIIEDDAPRDG